MSLLAALTPSEPRPFKLANGVEGFLRLCSTLCWLSGCDSCKLCGKSGKRRAIRYCKPMTPPDHAFWHTARVHNGAVLEVYVCCTARR